LCQTDLRDVEQGQGPQDEMKVQHAQELGLGLALEPELEQTRIHQTLCQKGQRLLEQERDEGAARRPRASKPRSC
jgi:hypothetical protein